MKEGKIRTNVKICDSQTPKPRPPSPPSKTGINVNSPNNITARLQGRAAFLRAKGQVKTPELLEEAARKIDKLDTQRIKSAETIVRLLNENAELVRHITELCEAKHSMCLRQSNPMAVCPCIYCVKERAKSAILSLLPNDQKVE